MSQSLLSEVYVSDNGADHILTRGIKMFQSLLSEVYVSDDVYRVMEIKKYGASQSFLSEGLIPDHVRLEAIVYYHSRLSQSLLSEVYVSDKIRKHIKNNIEDPKQSLNPF